MLQEPPRVVERDPVAGDRREQHELAGQRRSTHSLPYAEHDEYPQKACQQSPDLASGRALQANGDKRDKQRRERRGAVPDAGQHRRHPLLGVTEQDERDGGREDREHEQVHPEAQTAGRWQPANGEEEHERECAEGDAVQRDVRRGEVRQRILDEHEARAPDQGDGGESG
ncbi:hypothetical protein GCM10020218_073800 [Dactylosporangium vinaceum]